MDPLGRARGTILFAIFLLSGATSLVYQILWVRVLSLTVGSTVYAISLVIAAFMAGLALGSALFGSRADRWGGPLRVYAILEAGIGVSALVIPFVLNAFAGAAADPSSTLGALAGTRWFTFVFSFVLLLIPTTMMGGTLPVLSRYVAGFSTPRGMSIGALYSVNTIGAIVGTAITGFALIRLLGIHQATLVAAAGNGFVFVVGWALSTRWPAPPVVKETESGAKRGEVGAEDVALLVPVTIVYFINGLAGLAFEVLWTRAILLFSANTIYAFTVILTTFLLGLAIGSSVMSALIPRVRRVGPLLGGLQTIIGLIAAFTPLGLRLIGLPAAGDDTSATHGLSWFLAKVMPAYGVAVIFMLPATILMGASFPLVARVIAGATARVGHAVGRVYALNTLGAVLGSISAGFLALPALGIQGSITLFAVVAVASGLFLIVRSGSRKWIGVGTAAAVGVAAIAVLSPNHLRVLLQGRLGERLTFYEEGVETTVAVYESERAGRPVLVINNNALDDRGVVHKLLAHIPMLIHPRPQRALVLGFGVGITNESLSAHGIPVNHCVEISQAVMDAAPQFASLNGDIADRDDPNFTLFIEDGRRLLLGTREPYDVIALDANTGRLRNAGVGKLYTRDFFALCRDRLGPGGLVTVYVSPNGTLGDFQMATRTFQSVFPHTSLWVDRVYGQTCVLLGSLSPLSIDLDRWMTRLARPSVRADLAVFDLDGDSALLSCFIAGPEILAQWSAGGQVNTDDHPLMEFFSLSPSPFEMEEQIHQDLGYRLLRESVTPYLSAPPAESGHERLAAELESADAAFPSLANGWLAGWQGNMSHAFDFFRLSAALVEHDEGLRSLLGHGRAARDKALARADSTGDPADLSGAGLILYQRGEVDRAAHLVDRALAQWEGLPAEDHTEVRARLEQIASWCARDLGRVAPAREHLERAAQMGIDPTLDRLELQLVEAGPNPSARVAALTQLAQDELLQTDMMRALEVVLDLRKLGKAGVNHLLVAARILDVIEDYPGAWQLYREAAELAPDNQEARVGMVRLGMEIGLRLDRFRSVVGDRGRDDQALRSPVLDVRVPQGEIEARKWQVARNWLELADQYGLTGRFMLAYGRAQAARSLDPTLLGAYVAMGQAALALGDKRSAIAALEQAIELGGETPALTSALEAARR